MASKFLISTKQILLIFILYVISIYLADLVTFIFYRDTPYLLLKTFFSEKTSEFCGMLEGSIYAFILVIITDFFRVLVFGSFALFGGGYVLYKIFKIKSLENVLSLFDEKNSILEDEFTYRILGLCLIILAPIFYRFIIFNHYNFYCFK